MKTKTMLTLMAIALLNNFTSIAQSTMAFYQVQDMNYAQFENYAPNTILEYYSTNQGGKKLGTVQTNATGIATETFDLTHTPAFALNRKTSENSTGTNKVYYLKDKEFVANNIQLTRMADNVSITWNAQIEADNDISFQVLRSINNEPFTIAKTIKGSVGITAHSYSFSEANTENAAYKLQIVKDDKSIRFSSDVLRLANPSTVKIYPTVCTSTLFVDIPFSAQAVSYYVSDMVGKQIREGYLTAAHTTLDMSALVHGHYIVTLLRNDKHESFRITKQ